MVTPKNPPNPPEDVDPLGVVEQAAIAEELLAGPRHAARTKLATIRNAAFVIRQKLVAMAVAQQDPRLERFLGHIESEVDQLTRIIAEGHVSSSLRPPRPEPISLAEPIRRAVQTTRRAREHVIVDGDIPAATVLVDAEEAALAIRCLVENAVDASPEGGEVVIRCVESEDSVRVEVLDAGDGLDADAVSRSLRAFHTTRPGHAGLGLNIVRRFATKSGGDLALTPRPGGGLVAALALPRHPSPAL